MTAQAGFLAIWSDIDPSHETDYLHWLTREHTAERVSVPGFLGVRVFRARLRDQRRYFILYRLAEPRVVASEAYLARLNAPTAWSRRIMPLLQNFVRGGGTIVAEAGQGEGCVVVPILCGLEELERVRTALKRLVAAGRMVAVRLCEVARSGTDLATAEKAMREKDESFAALCLLEALADEAIDAALHNLPVGLPHPEPLTRYDQIFALRHREAAGL